MEFLCPPSNVSSIIADIVNSTKIETTSSEGLYQLSNEGNNDTILQALNSTAYNTRTTSSNVTRLVGKHDDWNYGDFTRRIAIPSLCVFGIIGNILNVIILSKKIKEGKKTYIIRYFKHLFVCYSL